MVKVVLVKIREDVHQEIWHYKIRHQCKSLSAAIHHALGRLDEVQ